MSAAKSIDGVVVAPGADRVPGGLRTVVVYLVAGVASHVVSVAGWSRPAPATRWRSAGWFTGDYT